jgi:GDPmannose 4,6-dehydratase
MVRRSSVDNLQRLRHIPKESLTLHTGDMLDPLSIQRAILETQPHEIYNEADQDHVDFSFATMKYSMDITAGAVGQLLEIVKNYNKSIKIFQPVSATMFGNAPCPQNEKTPFDPQSPYAVAKTAAYYLARHYREAYGMFVATAILYNHDSPRRGKDYLLQRICRAAVDIKKTGKGVISLGNLNGAVNIGYAKDYMLAAWQMMQLQTPDDFVISMGNTISVEALAYMALGKAGIYNHSIMQEIVVNNPDYIVRPGDHGTLMGDIKKARSVFGFDPGMTTSDLVGLIIGNLLEKVK